MKPQLKQVAQVTCFPRKAGPFWWARRDLSHQAPPGQANPKALATQAGGRVNKKLLRDRCLPFRDLRQGSHSRGVPTDTFGSGFLGRTRGGGVGWGEGHCAGGTVDMEAW